MPQDDKARTTGRAAVRINNTSWTGEPAYAPAHPDERDREMRQAKFRIGEVVRHKHFPFRGVVFDVDPVFDNTEEWYQAIPEEIRPSKDQPFYHLLAENADSEYVAYVSEQNLERDTSDEPVRHPRVAEALSEDGEGGWQMRRDLLN